MPVRSDAIISIRNASGRLTRGRQVARAVLKRPGLQAALAYVVPAGAAAVMVQAWFRDGSVLAAGDLVPPIAPSAEYRAHWSHLTDGAGTANFGIVWLPYFEGIRAFQSLGLGEGLFQRIWVTALVAAGAAAVVYLARSVFRSPLAAALAGVLATFNGYRLVTAFDPVPLVATIAAALLGGLVLHAARAESHSRVVIFGLISLMLGFVFVNPAHLVLVIGWVLCCAAIAWIFGEAAARARVARFLVKAVPLAVLLNLWWIVPAYLTVTSTVFAEQFSAPGVEAWAWTHERASLPNVISLTSTWAWPRPEYYPFAAGLEQFPFSAMKYLPAAVAVLGLLLARGRGLRTALVLSGVGFTAMWVMKGLHPPLGEANLWAYHHVPGFWLFRDPAKVGLVLVLVFSLLAAVAVLELRRISLHAGLIAAVAISAGALIYAHPLLTGGVIPDERPLLPSAHVHVPPAWREAAAYVDERPESGKAVVLPKLDYYQAPTTWGYYGASFVSRLFRRPIIEPLPGGYYSNPAVSRLVEQLEDDLLEGQEGAGPILHALGARYVLLRRDLDASFPGRSFVAPRRLSRALTDASSLRRLRSFGVVDVYEATGSRAPEVYPAVPLAVRGPHGITLYGALATRDEAIVPPTSEPAVGLDHGEVRLFTARGGGRTRVDVTFPRGRTVVTLARPAERLVFPFPGLSPPLRVSIGRQSFEVSRRQNVMRVLSTTRADAPRLYRFVSRRRVMPITVRPGLARRVGDCNAYDARTAAEVGLTGTVYGRERSRTLRLSARDHSACVAVPIRGFRPEAPLRLRLEYRGLGGNGPRLCVWQEGPDRCAQGDSNLLSSADWHQFETTVIPAVGTRSLLLFLYADGGAADPTTTEYRNLGVEFSQPAIAVSVSPLPRLPEVTYRRMAPYEFHVHVERAREPFLLVLSETFAPGWHLQAKDRSSAAAHGRVNGYANGWRVPWRGTYDLELTYGPERVALWARRADAVLIPLTLVLSGLCLVVRRRRRPDPQARPGGRPEESSRADLE
jgi:arabinofuranan 3-O-arabinosyltransferase